MEQVLGTALWVGILDASSVMWKGATVTSMLEMWVSLSLLLKDDVSLSRETRWLAVDWSFRLGIMRLNVIYHG